MLPHYDDDIVVHSIGLLKHFVSPVISDGDARRGAGLSSQLPAPIVSLYNAIISHLIECTTSKELQNLNWPVTEFVSSGDFSRGGGCVML